MVNIEQQKNDDSTVFDPIAVAQSLIPILNETSNDSEAQRRVVSRAISAISDSGLSAVLAPKEYGGYEMAPSYHIRTCAILARGCSAASWVHMVCGAHTFVLGRYPRECQQEVFGETPGVLIPGTLAPQGSARKVDGGWVLDGRWQFSSGVDHGPWLLIGAKAFSSNGSDPLPPIHVVVPTDAIEVDDTWHTLGLRATGSKGLVAQ